LSLRSSGLVFFGQSSVQGVSLPIKSHMASWRGRYLSVVATTSTERNDGGEFAFVACILVGCTFHGTKTTFVVDKARFLQWGRKGYI
jgi:hypothetical protein